jgi:plastocyanin
MPRLPLTALACFALAGGGVIAGCGDDNKSGSTPPAPPPPAQSGAPSGDTVNVSMKDIKFVPDAITVKVGQKIVWKNAEAVPHNVTAKEGAEFASENLGQGETFQYTPTKAGTINYVCTIHSGQNGAITVTK